MIFGTAFTLNPLPEVIRSEVELRGKLNRAAMLKDFKVVLISAVKFRLIFVSLLCRAS